MGHVGCVFVSVLCCMWCVCSVYVVCWVCMFVSVPVVCPHVLYLFCCCHLNQLCFLATVSDAEINGSGQFSLVC